MPPAARSTVEILRKHVMGYKPVYVETVSDASAVLTSSHAFNRVNWEDPHFNVGLPVFAIHGNHDDPIREGGKVRARGGAGRPARVCGARAAAHAQRVCC